MRRRKHVIALMVGVVLLGLVAEAGAAADFSPVISFELGDRNANANTTLRAVLKQDNGEEELDKVELEFPPGFSLASDQQLSDGETLGAGVITIDIGPRCRALGPASAPATLQVTIKNQERTSAQIASGVQAVYLVDIPRIPVPLLVYGSSSKGWRLEGQIPPSDDTCPPFTFDATFRARAATSNTPIIVNPQFGGPYTFGAIFTGRQRSVVESQQTVTIEGQQSGGGTQTTGTKSCKRLKGKKKKRCKKRLQG